MLNGTGRDPGLLGQEHRGTARQRISLRLWVPGLRDDPLGSERGAVRRRRGPQLHEGDGFEALLLGGRGQAKAGPTRG